MNLQDTQMLSVWESVAIDGLRRGAVVPISGVQDRKGYRRRKTSASQKTLGIIYII